MTIYAGDMLVNHELGNALGYIREIRRCSEAISKYGLELDGDVIARAYNGEIDSIKALREAIQENSSKTA